MKVEQVAALFSVAKQHARMVVDIASKAPFIPPILFVFQENGWTAIPLIQFSIAPEIPEDDVVSRTVRSIVEAYHAYHLGEFTGNMEEYLREAGYLSYKHNGGRPIFMVCLIGEGVQLRNNVEGECCMALAASPVGEGCLTAGTIFRIKGRDSRMRLSVLESTRIYGMAEEGNILLYVFYGWERARQESYAQYN